MHVVTLGGIAATVQALTSPDPRTGLVEEHWPVSTRLVIPASWRSGIYLVKLTAATGEQGCILFVIRPLVPQPVLVILPTMTYQTYNLYGGTNLYGWPGGPRKRSYSVRFDRPYALEYGAATFFRLDFPLVVWLEDHGFCARLCHRR